MTYNLTVEQVEQLWDGYMQGQTVSQLARRFDKRQASMYQRIQASGGIRPTIPRRAARHLTLEEREEISRGLATGHSLRRIAAALGRAPSTVAREIEANGGRSRYRAARADRAAEQRRQRPKPCKLAATPRLQAIVEAKLEKRWSPEQIAGWLKRTYPDDEAMRISHEAIYQALYIQGRGALQRELVTCLRTGRALRVPRARTAGRGKKFVTDQVMISARPAQVEDRAVPGHWESQ